MFSRARESANINIVDVRNNIGDGRNRIFCRTPPKQYTSTVMLFDRIITVPFVFYTPTGLRIAAVRGRQIVTIRKIHSGKDADGFKTESIYARLRVTCVLFFRRRKSCIIEFSLIYIYLYIYKHSVRAPGACSAEDL